MNPLMLFLFSFLAICFALVLIQRDLTRWQKFSLIINPALMSLIILLLIAKMNDDVQCTEELVPLAKATSALLALPAEQYGAERKAAAARIRQFTTDENMQKWQILAVDLEKITEKVQKIEKKP